MAYIVVKELMKTLKRKPIYCKKCKEAFGFTISSLKIMPWGLIKEFEDRHKNCV